ncbi:MAG: non-heme iron oxygenase ferredoxin subunit [Acidimicrobiia bacterium]
MSAGGNESARRVRACDLSELKPGEIRQAADDPRIAVYNVDGEIFATADLCTHDRSSLSQEGYLDGDQVECGWHMAKFCVRDGAVTAPPATEPLDTYRVCVDGADVYVVVDESDPTT